MQIAQSNLSRPVSGQGLLFPTDPINFFVWLEPVTRSSSCTSPLCTVQGLERWWQQRSLWRQSLWPGRPVCAAARAAQPAPCAQQQPRRRWSRTWTSGCASRLALAKGCTHGPARLRTPCEAWQARICQLLGTGTLLGCVSDKAAVQLASQGALSWSSRTGARSSVRSGC